MPYFGYCRDCGWWYISDTPYETEKTARANARKHPKSSGHYGHRVILQEIKMDIWYERMKNWDTLNYRNNDPHVEPPAVDPSTGAFLAHPPKVTA